MQTTDVIVAGHICLDITPAFVTSSAGNFGELLVPGKLLNVGACVVSTGGLVSNTGLALIRLGLKVECMGKVGDDTFGKAVLDIMRAYNAADAIIEVKGEQTSYTIVLAPSGIDRVFLHNPGANDTFGADDINYEKLDNARLFHLGYPPLMERLYKNDGRELADIFERAKKRGVTTSLDMSLPDPDSPAGRVNWKTILQKTLPGVDLFLPSAEEMLFCLDKPRFLARRQESRRENIDALDLFTAQEYSDLSGQLLAMGAGVVALKSGHRGIYVRTAKAQRLSAFGRATVPDGADWADRELWEGAFHVDKIASATGSGDCAIAGFLAAFLHGETVERVLTYATAAGCQNLSVYDAVSGIRSYEETAAIIPTLKKSKLSVADTNWKFDKEGNRWTGPNDAKTK